MGLAVEVGALAELNLNDQEGAEWLRESLDKVNDLLTENGLPAHVEPGVLPLLRNRAALGSYPYSFLHHLRRFAAHASANPKWKPNPFPEADDPADDSVVVKETDKLTSHLLCHSDCEGFYVPIDFPAPLFDGGGKVPGEMLGSSQGLMRELIAVTPLLGIKLTDGQLADVEADRINGLVESERPFWIELAVWMSLFEATRLSIEHCSAICFT